MKVVGPGLLHISMTGMMAATTVDSDGHNEGFCWSHHYAAATSTLVSDEFLGIAYYAMGPLEVSFLFQS